MRMNSISWGLRKKEEEVGATLCYDNDHSNSIFQFFAVPQHDANNLCGANAGNGGDGPAKTCSSRSKILLKPCQTRDL